MFLKRKKRASNDELAQELATVFCDGIEQECSDSSRLRWMWDAVADTDRSLVVKEWAALNMFLRSLVFRSEARDRKVAETLLDYFHGYAVQDLAQRGLFQDDGKSEEFLHRRYEDYYQAMRGSKDPGFQLMRIAEKFFGICGGNSVEAVLVASEYFTQIMVAEKKLITDLEKIVIIES
jgi:hypothetical protein